LTVQKLNSIVNALLVFKDKDKENDVRKPSLKRKILDERKKQNYNERLDARKGKQSRNATQTDVLKYDIENLCVFTKMI